jgi:hypothetical protein
MQVVTTAFMLAWTFHVFKFSKLENQITAAPAGIVMVSAPAAKAVDLTAVPAVAKKAP